MEIDFHIHSKYSPDSNTCLRTIIKIAKKRGLDGIAITDHNTVKGALKAVSLTTTEFVVIIGSEIETDKGEIIGLFLQEDIKPGRFVDVIAEIRDQGGVVVLPHPYKNKSANPEELLDYVDIVEGLNARISKGLNYKAQMLAKKFNMQGIAGSDAHLPIEIGRVRTIFPDMPCTIENIKKQLVTGKIEIYGSESPQYIRMLSRIIGRYNTGGINGLINASIRKTLNKI